MSRLRDELEGVLLDAMQGEPWGSALSGRLKTAARAVLLRHGLSRAQIHIEDGPDGVAVIIALPPGPARVRQLVVRLG